MNAPDEADIEAVAMIVGYHLAAIVSGNNQPHMSGDPRNRLPSHKRRWFDHACNSASAAAIAALRGGGWQRVPEGWKLVPSVPEGWMPMVHTWQDCMDFDAHMLNRLSVQEPTHRALLFQRVAGKLEELAMLRASSAAAPEPPA